MPLLPNDAKKISVEGSTVDFYFFKEKDFHIYFFDTSDCTPPGPMINAMAGLKLLKENSKLRMINHHSPDGLFPKIKDDFKYIIKELDDGRVQVEFILKNDSSNSTDFSDTHCNG